MIFETQTLMDVNNLASDLDRILGLGNPDLHIRFVGRVPDVIPTTSPHAFENFVTYTKCDSGERVVYSIFVKEACFNTHTTQAMSRFPNMGSRFEIFFGDQITPDKIEQVRRGLGLAPVLIASPSS